jgi:hypothetical protein
MLAGTLHRRRLHERGDDDSPRRQNALSLRKRLLHWNRIEAEPMAPLDVRVQEEIRDRFAGEVEGLGRLIDRDFSHWLKVGNNAS